jgi:hypothetical protein
MNSFQVSLLLSAIAMCLFGLPQSSNAQSADLEVAAPNGTDVPNKFENGFQIFWRSAEPPDTPNFDEITDPDAVIRIFDSSSHDLSVCQVMKAIRTADPNATGVSIYDVSVRKPGFIAVAAVYSRTDKGTAAVLLYFDWSAKGTDPCRQTGKELACSLGGTPDTVPVLRGFLKSGSLQRNLVLNDLHWIQSLEIDPEGHLWTLNDFDSKTPAASVFTEFDSVGSAIKNFVKPQRNWSTDESISKGGQPSFGLTARGAWAWLPSSRTLLSLDKETGKATVYQTGLPYIERSSNEYARQAALSSDGRLLMEVGWQVQNTHNAALFVWSSHAGWKSIENPVSPTDSFLYGVDGSRLIFASGSAFTSEQIGSLLPPVEER